MPAQRVEPDPEIGVSFEEVEEQVMTTDILNLRSTMDQGSRENIVTKLEKGEKLLRTGKGSNGWSRVEYQDQVLYCVSRYLQEV